MANLHQALRQYIITERVFNYLTKDINIYLCIIISNGTEKITFSQTEKKNVLSLLETGSS
jgi:hypothetical protein